MKLSDAAKQYEACMKNPADGCLCENCPLYKIVKIPTGEIHDETGQFTWQIQGCSLMAAFEKWLKNKKPGKPIDFE